MAKKIYSRMELREMESERKDYVNECLHKSFRKGDSIPMSVAVAACNGMTTQQELTMCGLMRKEDAEWFDRKYHNDKNRCLQKSISTHVEDKTVKYAELDDYDNIVATFTRRKRVRFIDID